MSDIAIKKSKKSYKDIFFNGIIKENPIFRLMLGMCPTLAVSTMAFQGIGMGLAATVVLIGSNFVISLLRNIIPEKVRIPSFIVVIATFVTIVQMLIKAFLPSLDAALGIYIPLIVVNCIIFARAESFAFKNKPFASVIDAVGMGLGFTLALTLLSTVREVIGKGTFFSLQIFPDNILPLGIIAQPPGGFLTLGILALIFNAVLKSVEKKNSMKEN